MISQTLIDVGLLVVGGGLLWKGADWVVHSACGLAHRLGLPDVVVGVSVVALGTSAPELMVAVLAADESRGPGVDCDRAAALDAGCSVKS